MTDETTGSSDDSNPDLTVEEMLQNMGDPQRRVSCPIDGCDYSHRSAMSVAGHVSASSLDRHVWTNTEYSGWKAFVRAHGEELEG